MTRILVCGGRDFRYKKIIEDVLNNFMVNYIFVPDDEITIIHGCANGVDTIAGGWAKGYYNIEEYPAQWDKYGKSAGFIRNKQMLEEGKPDIVIAFPGGKGTKMMVDLAKKAGVEVIDFND